MAVYQKFFEYFLFLQVRGNRLWGTDIYTDDSDIVAGMLCENKTCLCGLHGY